MAQIQRSDLVEKLRRAFSIITGSVGSTMSPELVGVVIVDDVTGADVISQAYPRSAVGGSQAAAAVGFNGKIGIENPVGSGVELFLEKVLVSFQTANGQFSIRRDLTPPAGRNAAISAWKDRRNQGNPSAITWDENATASDGTEMLLQAGLVNTVIPIPLGITLPPTGETVFVQVQATNATIIATFYWNERLIVGQ